MHQTLSRDRAWEILEHYTKSDSLLKHALAVEGVMRHFAGLYGENPDDWGVVGLLHDVDYEMYPNEHCQKCRELLKEADVPDWIIRACASHGYGICSELKPETNLEKVLYTIDELTGLIAAAALMRPSRSVMDLETKSVLKKYKSPSFAAGVDRSVIENGAAALSYPLDYVIGETILGMRKVAPAIGL